MSPTIGVLILHGFAGDVHDVLPLALFLKQQGFIVECPTLEGHGLSRRELGRSTRQQWIRSAEEAYKRLKLRADNVCIIGFSMGGLLAFQVAAKHPATLLITLNTPYRYWDLRQMFRYLREDFTTYSTKYVKSMTIPFRSLLQFRRLLAETKVLLPAITCPYHIIQANRDDTVHASSAAELRNNVSSSQVSVAYFAKSGHILLHGPEASEIIDHIHRKLTNSVG